MTKTKTALLSACLLAAMTAFGAQGGGGSEDPAAGVCQSAVEGSRLDAMCASWRAASERDKNSWSGAIIAHARRIGAINDSSAPTQPAAATTRKDVESSSQSDRKGRTIDAVPRRSDPARPEIAVSFDASDGEEIPAVTAMTLPALEDYVRNNCQFDRTLWCHLETRNSFKDVGWPSKVEGEELFRPASTSIHAFSGAVTDGDRIYFYGGGHAATYQNGVYALNLASLLWERVYDPDPLDDGGRFLGEAGASHKSGPCPFPTRDTAPAAGHSWGTPLLIGTDFHLWPSSFGCGKHGTSGALTVHSVFDLETGRWKMRRLISDNIVAMTAAGLTSDRYLVITGHQNPRLLEYDAERDVITRTGPSLPFSWGGYGSAIRVGDMLLSLTQFGIHGTKIGPDDFGKSIKLADLPGLVEIDDAMRFAKGALYLWDGEKSIYRTADFKDWQSFTDQSGPSGQRNIFNKFFYLPRQDVFIGIGRDDQIWLARPSDSTYVRPAALQDAGFECSDMIAGAECGDLQSLVAQGGEVILPKGVYAQCATIKRPTVLDGNGSVLMNKACGRKAAIVADADSTIRNLTCRNIAVSDGNGSCIRQQAANLTVENVLFEDSQGGILTNQTVESLTIRNSLFQRLGGDCRVKCGRAHGVYFGSPTGRLTIEGSEFLAGKDEGHLVKSAAAVTIIEDSVLDERGGNGSRNLDSYNGGDVRILNSRIIAAPGDGNRNVIGYGYEQRVTLPLHRLTIENSEIDCAGGPLLSGNIQPERVERGNKITNCR